ncbi:tripartite tricarboxylate transporter TctB family protein [Nitratireductor thuwali]|uniref:DUF1468 domain-containing protein n=1 Tax=Nitratireductor thuwali TaxID=2267699 RepID=A0ABY5MIM4_9HYPH|nr:hypothetical protein NTH_00169 [Nitratireductor thuwali]
MPPKPDLRPGEAIFALLVTIFGLAAFWQAYGISGFSGLATPGVFPLLAAGTMVMAGLFILADAIRRHGPRAGGAAAPVRFLREVMPVRHVIVIGLVLVYLVLLPALGFVVGSGLFLFAAFQYLWRKNLLVTAALTIGALGGIHFVFRTVFQVVLPQGSLFGGLI